MVLQIKKILSITITLVFLAFAIWYLARHWSDLAQITQVSIFQIILMVAALILGYICVGIINRSLLLPLHVRMSQLESFRLAIVTGFYNLITPFKGGMAVRAVYLKKKHNFSYTDFLATLAASYILIFLVSGIAGLLATWMLPSLNQHGQIILYVLFGITALLMAGVMIISPKIPETKYNWLNRFIRVINGWHLIRKNPRVIATTLIFSSLQLIFNSWMIYLQFQALSISLSPWGALLIGAVSMLSLLIAITPAGFGINEALVILSASALGISPAQSLAAALLGRAVNILVLFILGPIYSYLLIKKPAKEQDLYRHSVA